MIFEICDLLNRSFSVSLGSGDYYFNCLFTELFGDLISTLVEKVVCIRTLYGMFLTIQNNTVKLSHDIHLLFLLGLGQVPIVKFCIKTCPVACMACCSRLVDLIKERIFVTVDICLDDFLEVT